MKKTISTLITELRKENGMTQAQLAEKMGVTDKAVSKWERDLSCPDINSIPKLAEILGTTVEQLMQGEDKESPTGEKAQEIVSLVLKAVSLAMGVAVTVLTILDKVETKSAIIMLGIGLACVALNLLQEKNG